MSEAKSYLTTSSSGEPYKILKESLDSANTVLTSFLFHHGANIYALSYEKDGTTRHTLIDSGDARYRNGILSILVGNGISPGNIEGIILTHRHADHTGLADFLAKESKARITVHANFRGFVEDNLTQEPMGRMGGYDTSRLKECDIEYLEPSDRSKWLNINGILFPSLGKPIEIGKKGKLMILACPESTPTHAPDQVIVLYSPKGLPQTALKASEDYRPTDDMLFSGDLWLMRGPVTDWRMRDISHHLRYGYYQIKSLTSGRTTLWRNPREQDARAKDALKRGFCLIRVKPGHGEEFIGSRIIPNSLPSDRDLLIELGYSPDADRPMLKSKDMTPRIASIMEKAYASFVKELLFWAELGYTLSEISGLLVRIYKEQSGGDSLAQEERKQRRERLKATLTRLREDEAQSDELHQLAELTLSGLKGVK